MKLVLLVAGGVSLAFAASAFWQSQRSYRCHVWTPVAQPLNLKEANTQQVHFVADGAGPYRIGVALQRAPLLERLKEDAVLEQLAHCVHAEVFCEGVAVETGGYQGQGWGGDKITCYLASFSAIPGKRYTVQLTVTKPLEDPLTQKASLRVEYSIVAFKATYVSCCLWQYAAIFFFLTSLPFFVLSRKP